MKGHEMGESDLVNRSCSQVRYEVLVAALTEPDPLLYKAFDASQTAGIHVQYSSKTVSCDAGSWRDGGLRSTEAARCAVLATRPRCCDSACVSRARRRGAVPA
eukprot:5612597-Pleurochrysis_carterae.AAC.4